MTRKPSCFIAMPITVHENEAELYGDAEHWAHVMDHLFVPAIEAAGYEPIVPSASGTSMIHGRIVKHLVEADMVLCDLSRHNPNVLFELGVRTALNRPVALVKDEHLKLPFDIQGLNTHPYSSQLSPWSLDDQVTALTAHISNTADASENTNPLWVHFGVSISASQPPSAESPEDAKLQLILEKVQELTRPSNPRIVSSLSGAAMRAIENSAMGAAVSSIAGVVGVSMTPHGSGVNILVKTEAAASDVQHMRVAEVADAIARTTSFGSIVTEVTTESIQIRIDAAE